MLYIYIYLSFTGISVAQEFMRVVDPCSNGMLDPVELEKALAAVREDEARRRPGVLRGGPYAWTLGEEARRLSRQPELDASGKELRGICAVYICRHIDRGIYIGIPLFLTPGLFAF